jgi:hypothetical protein
VSRPLPNILASRYAKGRDPAVAEALWESIRRYYFGLTGSSMMQGWHPREVQGAAFLKMLDAARDWNPEVGVDFILYFRLRLHGMLLAMRQSEKTARQRVQEMGCACRTEPGTGALSRAISEDAGDGKAAVERIMAALPMDTPAGRLAATMVRDYAERGARPRRMKRGGMSREEFGEAIAGLPEVVSSLIF